MLSKSGKNTEFSVELPEAANNVQYHNNVDLLSSKCLKAPNNTIK